MHMAGLTFNAYWLYAITFLALQTSGCGPDEYFDRHYGARGTCRPCEEICNPATAVSMTDCVDNGCTPITTSTAVPECGPQQYFDGHYGGKGACRSCDEICNPARAISMQECFDNGCTPGVRDTTTTQKVAAISEYELPDNIKWSIISAVLVALALVLVIALICVIRGRKQSPAKDKQQTTDIELMQVLITTVSIPTAPELSDVVHKLCMSPKPAPLVTDITNDRLLSNDCQGVTNPT